MLILNLHAKKLLTKSQKNIFTNNQYRQPAGNFNEFE